MRAEPAHRLDYVHCWQRHFAAVPNLVPMGAWQTSIRPNRSTSTREYAYLDGPTIFRPSGVSPNLASTLGWSLAHVGHRRISRPVTGFNEHLNGLLDRILAVLGRSDKRNCGMIRPALFIEPGHRLRNEPRSDIPPRFLVARKLLYRGDHEFRIDAGLDQRTELLLGGLARVWSIPRRVRLPKFLEFFARIRSGRVSDRPRESFLSIFLLPLPSFLLHLRRIFGSPGGGLG